MCVSIFDSVGDCRPVCLRELRSTSPGLLLLVLTLLIAPGKATVAADGLGGYGVTGEIHRHHLPSGMRGRVSDQSISMAQSPEFSRARLLWSRQTPANLVVAGEIDFVGQIDYQLSFRSHLDYLNSNSSQIAKVLETKPENKGIQELGLYLSHAEAAEMNRRDKLGAQATRLERLAIAMNRSNYATVWQDQSDGGKLVLAVKDRSALSRSQIQRLRRVVGSGNLKIVEQRYSERQQERFKDRLASALKDYNVGYIIDTVKAANGAKKLAVRTPNPEMLPKNFAPNVPRSAYSLVRGNPPSLLGLPINSHSWYDMMPGLWIAVRDWWNNTSLCTWGLNAHTSSYNYLVTAGHCLPGLKVGNSIRERVPAWKYTVYQATPNNLREKQLTERTPYVFGSMVNTDVLRIESRHAGSNCYHGFGSTDNAHCRFFMKNFAEHNSWKAGVHRTCASLASSNMFVCGTISDFNARVGIPTENGYNYINRMVRVDFRADRGDSGAGLVYRNTIDGMLIAEANSAYVYGITAHDVQRKLGVKFNCANSEKRNRSARAWGNCPSVDRSP